MSANYVPEQFYLRSVEEMKARFAEVPEAVANTLEVAEKCNLEIEFGTLHYPVFAPPEHFTREGYLRQLLAEGLQRRYTLRARAEGKEFVVEGIEDPTRLPTYSSESVISKSVISNQSEGSPSTGSLNTDSLITDPSVAAAIRVVIDR